MPRVNVKGYGFVTFPDGMSEAEMKAAIDKLVAGKAKVIDDEQVEASPAREPEQPSTSGFISNVVSSGAKNAAGMVKGIYDMVTGMAQPLGPMVQGERLVHGVADRAKQYYNDVDLPSAGKKLVKGDIMGAIGTALPASMMYHDPVGVALDAATIGEGVSGVKAAKSGITARSARRAHVKSQRGGPTYGPEYDPQAAFNEKPLWAQMDEMFAAEPPPPHSNPEFVSPGQESAYNGRQPARAPFTEPLDSTLDTIIKRESQYSGQPHTPTRAEPAPTASSEPRSFLDTMLEPDTLDWHSGAEPGSAEARSASSLHRDLGEMDNSFRRRMDDDRGYITPDLLFRTIMGQLAREAIRGGVRTGARKASRLPLPSLRGTAHAGFDLGLAGRLEGEER